jgi:beta-N-acetylhexosaminidase
MKSIQLARQICMTKLINILLVIIVLSTCFPMNRAHAAPDDQEQGLRRDAQGILAQLTPEEKVGQLFLITFKGRDLNETSPVYNLIVQKHVGGVILLPSNDNFSASENTIRDLYTLTSTLQQLAFLKAQGPSQDPTALKQDIPLLIGINQEGDLSPYDSILNGVSSMPNEMAIGATWDPQFALKVGTVTGKELSAMGINLLLGPSLDVLEQNPSQVGEDLGTRTFGGDPFWVGVMGRAYIQGLHQGSNNHLAVIAKHFPGRGSSDRPPEAEVATVRKSLEQLKQMELSPFFAVTGNPVLPETTTDGLLLSHIRYQGFQGNIRATTRPVSFDPTALDQILKLEQFSIWRQNGGLIVSDDLGSQAVRLFYDPNGTTFDARQVARNAFLAGNDLLYANNFVATGDPDSYSTITRTLELFTQKYREDPAFAQRVDASVERILMLKLRLYPEFKIGSVTPTEEGLADIGQSAQVSFEIAQEAATLLSPGANELADILPRPPSLTDRVIILTDVRTSRQCSQCPEQNTLSVDSLQKTIFRLYGPAATGQILLTKYSSYAFTDLILWLNGNITDTVTALDSDLILSDWVIIVMLDVNPNYPESNAVRRLLSEKASLLRNKKVITFAFNAPYYLDATDVSKLTAYYGMYSKEPSFIDVAALLLFQELNPVGASPVSIPGVGYDLITSTSPDPQQILQLYLDLPQEPVVEATFPGVNSITPTFEPTPVPKFKVGDTLPMRTGVIIDHNQHPVPDGTVVRFLVYNNGEATQTIETTTVDGIARASYRIQAEGLLEFRLSSDPALVSNIIQLNSAEGQAVAITAIAPTSQPSSTPTLTSTSTLSPTHTSTPTPTPPPPPQPGTTDWFGALLISFSAAIVIYFLGRHLVSIRWGVRWGLLAGIGGTIAYLFIMAGTTGSDTWYQRTRFNGVLLASLVGILVGWLIGWLWLLSIQWRLRRRGNPTSSE